jgi:diguanylate cyclase (GGDEF)-like protein/putative nucleotidyltransferase with HDIG domain/PAS domain S-box-containing protein
VKRWKQPLRLSIGLTSLITSILFAGLALGLFPDSDGATLRGRKSLCEAVAIHCATAAERGDVQAIQTTTQAIAERDADLLSAAVRRADGTLLAQTGDHEANWQHAVDAPSDGSQIRVPIAGETAPWGQIEFRFRPLAPQSSWAPLPYSILGLMLFVAPVSFLIFLLYLKYVGRVGAGGHTGTTPRHVRDALNTLTEGVLILDKQRRIAMANEAFARLVGQSATELEGRDVASFDWHSREGAVAPASMPWDRAAEEGIAQTGTILTLKGATQGLHTLSINATSVVDPNGDRRGTLVTLDDQTLIEKKNAHLRKLLQRLREARAAMRRQNEELRAMATRDPLTNCFNRRAFFAELETQWASASRYDLLLSCVLVDIDHFKSINDRFGHGVGDKVLQHVGATLLGTVRKGEMVCRYGGEEFCILLPHCSLADAYQAAERYRDQLAANQCAGVSVTASLGVSSLSLGATTPGELLDQADKALYHAKRSGRNRAICFDDVPDGDMAPSRFGARRAEAEPRQDAPIPIPFHAVTALVTALAHRHADTAHHSRRVADLAVTLANGLLTQTECYVLEVAALLHDIGKIGVPDAVLLKPGPLNPAEWKVIRTHEEMGEQIVAAAFTSPELTAMIAKHHCWFGGSPHDPHLPIGSDIPLGARILSICDAFDAMVSDRVYRRGRSEEEAFKELRRCSGTQFDPELVARFIERAKSRDDRRTRSDLVMSKQIALEIGLEIERLAATLDDQNASVLALRAGRLRATAQAHGVTEIAQAAAQLEGCASDREDWARFTDLTIELMDLCRATYRSYLPPNAEVKAPAGELVAVR